MKNNYIGRDDMPAYSQDFAEEVKQNIDIVEVISEYLELKRTGKNYKGLCPFHQEKTPSFTVNPQNQFYYCFGCGAGGDVYSFLMEIENITFFEGLKLLAGRAGLELPNRSKYEKRLDDRREKIFEINQLAAKFYNYLLLEEDVAEKAVVYLNNRGFMEEDLKKFYLGFAPDRWDSLINFLSRKGYERSELLEAGLVLTGKNNSIYDRFRNRIIFPIFNIRDEVIAFGARIVDSNVKNSPKYLNSPETIIFNKSKNLYGLNWAREELRRTDSAIIMEGYTDVIRAHKQGLKNAVASLGTSLTLEQAKLLDRYVSTVYIAYDADTAGGKATVRGLEILKNAGLNVKVIQLPADKDPDDFINQEGKEKFTELMEDAPGLIDYKINQIVGKNNFNDSDIKVELSRKLIKLLAGISDPVEREVYTQRVSTKIEINAGLLRREVEKMNKKDKNYRNRYTKNTNKTNIPVSINKLEAKILKAFIDYPGYRGFIIEELNPGDFKGKYNRLAEKLWSESSKNLQELLASFEEEKIKKRFMEITVMEKMDISQNMLKSWVRKLKEYNRCGKKLSLFHALEEDRKINLDRLNNFLVDFHRLSIDQGKEGL